MNYRRFQGSAILRLGRLVSYVGLNLMSCVIGSKNFPSLKPVKRRGNRRYYQRHDVILIRQIRSLLYEQGYNHWWGSTEASGFLCKRRQQSKSTTCPSGASRT